MLEIRRDQLAALAEARAASLPQRITDHLHQVTPARAAALPRKQLDALVDDAIARARRWGIAIEWDLFRFVLLALELTPSFDGEAWAADVLGDDTLTPTERMDELEDAWSLRSGGDGST